MYARTVFQEVGAALTVVDTTVKAVIRAAARTAVLAALLVGSTAHAPAAIPRYSTNPDDFVRNYQGHFWVNKNTFRFVGYNLRGLCHYGCGDILAASSYIDRQVNLGFMKSVGARVARVFVSCKFIDAQTTGDRLNTALQIASQNDVYLIVCFTDEYSSGFCPQGDEAYYDGGLLGYDFYDHLYTVNYLPLILNIVERFKYDPTVFAWELGNELKYWSSPTVIIPFAHTVSEAIRAVDSNHMVGFGTGSRLFCNLTWDQGVQLYSGHFDYLTQHPYNGSDWANDASLASYLGKPLLIEEAGFDESYDRPTATSQDIAKWVNRGAKGYMNWGLMATAYNNGDGDSVYGIDRVLHSDFDEYAQVYSTWAEQLSIPEIPGVGMPENVTASVGTYGDRVRVQWEPGLHATQYAVFRAASPTGAKAQVSDWQSGCSFDDTTAPPGQPVYYYVKAARPPAESGYAGYALGIRAAPTTCGGVKLWKPGTFVCVENATVSAVFADTFYVQDEDRCSGIAVSWDGGAAEGDIVNVIGQILLAPNKERYIAATSVAAAE